jgi:hypothetical protein
MMADAGIFIGWGVPVRGREQKALQVFQESVEYWSSLQASGDIESFEVAILEPHGGDLGGFALLRGESEKLAQVRASEDFQLHVDRANLIVDSLGVVGAAIGDGIATAMARYGEVIAEIV